MRSEQLNRVIDAFGPSEAQKQRMFVNITGLSSTGVRRKGGIAKVLFVAAAICLFTGTAYAFSYTDLFKKIFGNNIYLVEDQILFPIESVSGDRFRLTLEGVLSDDYSRAAIVMVEALNEQAGQELKDIPSNLEVALLDPNIRANSTSVVELDHLSDQNSKRFMLVFRSFDGPVAGDLEIRLTADHSLLTLTAPASATIPSVTIRLDEANYASADYVPHTVVISPLSAVVIGHERNVGYAIPNPSVTLHFANGTTIDVFKQETGFGGSRFPEEGISTVSARFERLIDLGQLRSVTVDGTEYPIKANESN